MADPLSTPAHGTIVEEEMRFTLIELCRVCHADSEQLTALIAEGVIEPAGSGPHDWEFSGAMLSRTRTALRLSRDLQLNTAGTALVLDLLDEIEDLKSRLRRMGAGAAGRRASPRGA